MQKEAIPLLNAISACNMKDATPAKDGVNRVSTEEKTFKMRRFYNFENENLT
jgi:hypothetical protein